MKTCKVRDPQTGDTAIVIVPDGWTRREQWGRDLLFDERGQLVDVEVYKNTVWALRDGKRHTELVTHTGG